MGSIPASSMIHPYSGRSYLLNLIDTPVCPDNYFYNVRLMSVLGPCRLRMGSVSLTRGVPGRSALGRCLPGCPGTVSISLPRGSRTRLEDYSCSEQSPYGLHSSEHLRNSRLVQIDLPAAQPEIVAAQMQSTFGIDPNDVLQISAKSGKGVESVLQAIIDRIPPPQGNGDDPLKAFLFDSS